MQLRVSVEGAGSQVLDTEMREIAVPDLTGAADAARHAGVFRARTARDFQQLKADADAVPLGDARVQPHRSPADPRADLRARRHDADAERAPAEPRRLGDDRAARVTPSPKAGEQQIDLPLAGSRPANTSSKSRSATRTATRRSWSASASPADASMRGAVAAAVARGAASSGCRRDCRVAMPQPPAPHPRRIALVHRRRHRAPTRAAGRRRPQARRFRAARGRRRCSRSRRSGSSVPPPPRDRAPVARFRPRRTNAQAAVKRRRAAVRDLPRRIPRRARREHRPRARGAARVSSIATLDAARSRRGHEAARFAVRDPADRRSRRGARTPSRASRAARATTSRATPTSANYIAGTPARIDAARNQVALSALNALAVHLGSLDRRPQDADRASAKASAAPIAGAARSTCRRSTRSIRSANRVERRRSTRSIRATRARPMHADGARRCGRLADDTDGSAIGGDLDAGLRRAAADASAYYLLSYPVAAPRRRQVPRAAGAGEARRRAPARAQGLLGARRRTTRCARRCWRRATSRSRSCRPSRRRTSAR